MKSLRHQVLKSNKLTGKELVSSTPIASKATSKGFNILPDHELFSPIFQSGKSSKKSSGDRLVLDDCSSWETVEQETKKSTDAKKKPVEKRLLIVESDSDSDDEVLFSPSKSRKQKSKLTPKKNKLIEESSDSYDTSDSCNNLFKGTTSARNGGPKRNVDSSDQSEEDEPEERHPVSPKKRGAKDSFTELPSFRLLAQANLDKISNAKKKTIKVPVKSPKKNLAPKEKPIPPTKSKNKHPACSSKSPPPKKDLKRQRGPDKNQAASPKKSKKDDFASIEEGLSQGSSIEGRNSTRRRKMFSQPDELSSTALSDDIEKELLKINIKPVSKIPRKTSLANKKTSQETEVLRKSSRCRTGQIRFWEQRLNYVYSDGVASLDTRNPVTKQELLEVQEVPKKQAANVKPKTKTKIKDEKQVPKDGCLSVLQKYSKDIEGLSTKYFKSTKRVSCESIYRIKVHGRKRWKISSKTYVTILRSKAKVSVDGKLRSKTEREFVFDEGADVTITNESLTEEVLLYSVEY